MTTLTTEETGTATATAAAQPKAAKKARAAARSAHAAPKKGKPGKKAKAPKKAPKGAKKATAREGTKVEKILDLLKRPEGATLAELMKATGWLAHSVRGFLSGTLRKKLGLNVMSTKGEDGDRSYSVKA
jgi:hypothetical protein